MLKTIKPPLRAALFVIFITIAVAPAASSDEMTTKTGMLTCHVASGFGYIVGSSRTVDCEYIPWVGPAERYSGTVTKIGIDIGYLAPIAMLWAVIAPSTVPSTGALAGNYFGATAQAAVGLGGGISFLTGGFQKSVALQPLTVEGDTGLYIGVGIASMSLKLEDR